MGWEYWMSGCSGDAKAMACHFARMWDQKELGITFRVSFNI